VETTLGLSVINIVQSIEDCVSTLRMLTSKFCELILFNIDSSLITMLKDEFSQLKCGIRKSYCKLYI
jgi:hypothetical protein